MEVVITIPTDKLKHFGAGAIASAFVYAVTGDVTPAIAIAAALGIGKEIYDSLGYGTVEVLDAVATAVGGAVGVIIMTWT